MSQRQHRIVATVDDDELEMLEYLRRKLRKVLFREPSTAEVLRYLLAWTTANSERSSDMAYDTALAVRAELKEKQKLKEFKQFLDKLSIRESAIFFEQAHKQGVNPYDYWKTQA